jgi:hypothetical protein
MLLGILGLFAVLLTCTMFATKNAMLGFPSAIFWALFGGQAYTLSTATWDIYFDIAFAAFLGMTVFTMFGAWGLREGRVTTGEDSMAQKDDVYIDEENKDDAVAKDDEFEVAARPSRKR